MSNSFLFIASLFCLLTCAQKDRGDKSSSYSHEVGETKIRITVHDHEPLNGMSFVVLHDNEETATESAKKLVPGSGGRLVLIENNNKRNLSFRLAGRLYSFDPNRMFTEAGIKQSLALNSRYNEEAAREVSEFSSFILTHLGEPKLTIALHNNRNNTYSIVQYVSGNLQKEAAAVYHNPEMDHDDFVLTTNRKIYDHFRAAGISAVLQNSDPSDDGSLSVLLAKKGNDYVNIECQHGHNQEQERMIRVLYEMKF